MRIRSFWSVSLLFVSLIFGACQSTTAPEPSAVLYQSDFRQGPDGWTTGIADYSPQTADINFQSAWSGLPLPLDTTRKSIRLSSMNRSDDVFMFLKKKLTGLSPSTQYRLVFDLELASKYANNSIGIGGSPGSSVFLKAGATASEPMSTLVDDLYQMNIDKGNQVAGGKDMQVLGNIGAGDDLTDYRLISRSNANGPFTVQSNAQGELWLIIGTDSGYEGLTELYYSQIRVTRL